MTEKENSIQEIIFLVPEVSAEFKLRFSGFKNSIFIEEIAEFDKIPELCSKFEKVLVVDPDFVN